jgi:hemerythrin superfamily protein
MPRRKSAHRAPASRRATSRTNGAGQNALQLLRADHRKVEGLFAQFEKARSDVRKEQLAQQICAELTVHAAIEEEILYPAARAALRAAGDLLDEASVEHASAKQLIGQIESVDQTDGMFDAKVKVLGEYVKHHVKEEQNELFPKLRKSRLDLKALGLMMSERKQELMQEA